MSFTLEIDGLQFYVDLSSVLGGSGSIEQKESDRKEGRGMEIQFESEGYNFSVSLGDLVNAESIEEAEKKVLCWREEESSTTQLAG